MKRVGKPYAVAYGFMLNFKGGFSPLSSSSLTTLLLLTPLSPQKRKKKSIYIFHSSLPASFRYHFTRKVIPRFIYIYSKKKEKKNKNKIKKQIKEEKGKLKLSIVTTLLKQEGIKGYKRQMKQRTLLTSLDKPKTICKRFTTITQIPLLE